MKNRKFVGQLAMGLAGVAGLASVASAGTITTPPLEKANGDYFMCRVLNTGTTDRDVVIETRSASGSGAANGPFSYTVPAGGSVAQLAVGNFYNTAFCIVTGETSKTKMKVSFCVKNSGGDRCDTTVTVP